jgi:hypothetical protein
MWFGVVLVSSVLGLCLAFGAAGDEPKAVRVYTNEDLKRVSPRKGETGVLSEPGAEAAERSEPKRETLSPARGESYWRREAERLKEWAEAQREAAAELAARADERRKRRGVLASSDPQIRSWERRIRAIEARVRERQVQLEDRARREGALPGWLR